jgi:hypothetical protein
MQRFYPLLAGVALITGALTLASIVSKGLWSHRIASTLLLVGAVWNISETLSLQKRAHRDNAGPALTAQKLRPENVELTRASYALFGFYPPYFSHGRMDPAFELRLLDQKQTVILDNALAITRSASLRQPALPSIALNKESGFQTDGIHDYLLDFDLPTGTKGAIIVRGKTRSFAYVLPEFGYPQAFGAEATSRRSFAVRTGGIPAERLSVQAHEAEFSMRAIPYLQTELPLRLESLVPFKVHVEAPAPSLLETPRVFISGYRATLNGRVVPVTRSAAGLVALPVPAGPSDVVIDYPGPTSLRICYYTSLVCLLSAWFWVLRLWWQQLKHPTEDAPLDLFQIRRWHLLRMKSRALT